MRILISYRAAPRIREWETGALVAEAFRSLGHEVFEYAKMYETQEWVHYADPSNEYDLAIYMECNDPDPQYTELKYANAKKRVAWIYDISYYPGAMLNILRYFEFDHIYCANPQYVHLLNIRFYGDELATYLPYAVAPEFYRPIDWPKTMDIALVGSARPDRIELISVLQTKGLNAHMISGLFKEQYINALASAKIIINQNPKEGLGLLNMRHWEGQAAGALIIEQKCDWDINKSYLYNNMVTYENIDDLADKCKYLLDVPKFLRECTIQNQTDVMLNNTYRDRAKAILATL